ncbi:MAG: hypothetical protein D6714_04725, partial [Bacteroidetes bacterium]
MVLAMNKHYETKMNIFKQNISRILKQIITTMKIPWTLFLMLSACYLTASPPEISGAERWAMTAENSAYREADIQKRLAEMDCLFEPKYTNEVEAYLRAYLTYGRKDAEDLLGRSVLYFPVFEHYLQLHGLPEQLKYLPMIESRLHPVATSTTGAAGLWQFMPATARSLGLQINEYVDERRDPYKSTKAALQYLSRLYDRFGTWELTLAAYNCGSARVSRAIRYAGTTDFWEVRKYLPSETRKYVPRFIAANYLVNFYHVHGLSPNFPSFDIQWTRTTLVYTQFTFGQIAQKTGAPISLLYRLNPAYKKGVIPANPNGNFLILPEPAMEKFKAWQSDKNPVAHKV